MGWKNEYEVTCAVTNGLTKQRNEESVAQFVVLIHSFKTHLYPAARQGNAARGRSWAQRMTTILALNALYNAFLRIASPPLAYGRTY